MRLRFPSSRHVVLFPLSCIALLVVLHAEDPAGFPKDLGGGDRARAFLATDKPMYREGETVYARGVVLDALSGALKADGLYAQFEVKGPKGDVVAQTMSSLQAGTAPFTWEVPEGTPGGEYTLVASFPWNGYAPAETKFDVRAYRVPRLKGEIVFAKKGYGPGDEVSASLSVTRAEGGIPAGAKATAVARVDGNEVARQEVTLDARGACSVSFPLPKDMAAGDGDLAIVVQDGGTTETFAKTLPILLNKVAISFFPEGGDLVAGLENRLYFEARDTRQKPADVQGRILDRGGKDVATFATSHEGRGTTRFTPKDGETYSAVIDVPAANTQRFELPKALASGCLLSAASDTYDASGSVAFTVASTEERNVRLSLFRVDREVSGIAFSVSASCPTQVTLRPSAAAEGVLRATLTDDAGAPLAERLIFRRPAHKVNLKVVASPDSTTPAGRVSLAILATDETGKPVETTLCISVTDEAVLQQIEKREQAPRLPVQVLLGSDVKELADAHLYLSDAPEAPRAVDLLLGTQGWRRFCFFHAAEFVKAQEDAAKRVLALRDQAEVERLREFGGGGLEMEEADGAMPPAPAAPMPQAHAMKLAKKPAADPAQGPAAEKKDAMAGRRRAGNLKALDKERAFAGEMAYIREYAHVAQAGRPADERSDFAETVYWNAGVKTAADGTATVTFDLSDSITMFSARVDAITASGALGQADAAITAKKAFYIEPKLPLEITAGDLVEVPVALVNGTQAQIEALLETTIGEGIAREGNEPRVTLAADASGRLFLTLVAKQHYGPVQVHLIGKAGDHTDEVKRAIQVVPSGFPVEESAGGLLSGSASHEIVMPEQFDAASVEAVAKVYPSPLATLTDALKGLLREPGGCFEQTSSNAYPNIMVMNYFTTHHVEDAALMARASDLLDRGYKRLVGYECPQKGYEWFGGDPGHEALTAYGVMEFSDMAKVYPVDAGMIERTRAWLLSRRDGKGGFTRNPRALDSFGGAPDDVTNAYILWALAESGEKGLEKEIEWAKARAGETQDSYVLGLIANALLKVGDPAAAEIASKIAKGQEADGCVRGAATSITRSGGECLEIETTSLAVLAWLRVPEMQGNVEKAATWLFERCKGGRFGSTQSTIMALRAILGYDAARAVPKAPGTAILVVDGAEVGRVDFTPETKGDLTLPSFASRLTPGAHTIEVKMEGGAEMPYAVDVRYHAPKPANSEACQVRVETALSASEVKEGETVDVVAKVTSLSKEGLPMTLAIVGLPGGLEPRHDQLKELVKSGAIDFYEVLGRDVVLYWRDMAPEQVAEVRMSCVAAVPGRYTGAASRAYLYYTDNDKWWVDGLRVTITHE